MENSILNSTKKILGIDPSYTMFDLDILTHINAVFSTLEQLGIGPEGGFFIEDERATWQQFLTTPEELAMLNAVRAYMYLKVRMGFDPPTTSYLIDSMERQINQYEWRLNVAREYAMSQQEVTP